MLTTTGSAFMSALSHLVEDSVGTETYSLTTMPSKHRGTRYWNHQTGYRLFLMKSLVHHPKKHKTTQARGDFQLRPMVQLAAYNDGVARRMAV